MSQRQRALQVLNELIKYQVEHLVVCPGGRSAPIVDLLTHESHPFKLHFHLDERAASFYALGLSQNLNAPVAVIVTSGTAVSETLSACIEAHYTSTPLMIVSADRPKTYRGTGAPQTIRQTEVLKSYVTQVIDLEDTPLDLSFWEQSSPLHLNVCFDEPLVDKTPFNFAFSPLVKSLKKTIKAYDQEIHLDSITRPLIVVSGSHGFDKDLVKESLKELAFPIYFESTSGLKNHPDFKNREIYFPEKLLSSGQINGVIRVGHIPTHRFWRDLEASSLSVVSFSQNSFSGLSRSSKTYPLEALCFLKSHLDKHTELGHIKEQDEAQREKLNQALKDFPLSEAAQIFRLQNHWNPDFSVYLGNSLPIREWDLVQSSNFSQVHANRGANGIDGQLSTYFGLNWRAEKSLGLFGDLTTIYDLNAPWVIKKSNNQFHIAVVNNSGGMIFDSLFGKDIYLNKHEFQFKSVAEMWGLSYQVFSPNENPFLTKGSQIIELRPDIEQSKAFQKALK